MFMQGFNESIESLCKRFIIMFFMAVLAMTVSGYCLYQIETQRREEVKNLTEENQKLTTENLTLKNQLKKYEK